jgi:hypothetical protein
MARGTTGGLAPSSIPETETTALNDFFLRRACSGSTALPLAMIHSKFARSIRWSARSLLATTRSVAKYHPRSYRRDLRYARRLYRSPLGVGSGRDDFQYAGDFSRDQPISDNLRKVAKVFTKPAGSDLIIDIPDAVAHAVRHRAIVVNNDRQWVQGLATP